LVNVFSATIDLFSLATAIYISAMPAKSQTGRSPNKKTYGELLFEGYLDAHEIAYTREPQLSFTSNLIDYVLDHPTHGQIFFEVKDIHNAFPATSGAYDPYDPVLRHIEEGRMKFKDLPDALCALVLVAAPGSFVDLQAPHIMLGSMYGRMGFTIPFNTKLGHFDGSQMKREFLIGSGKMVRRGGVRNSRIAALVSLHNYHTYAKEGCLYARTDDGRTEAERWEDVYQNRAGLNAEPTPCVTVWENGTARRRLPQDIFRGAMDAWWTAQDGLQQLSYIGQKRLALKIDSKP
jgi:hypothetical protein